MNVAVLWHTYIAVRAAGYCGKVVERVLKARIVVTATVLS